MTTQPQTSDVGLGTSELGPQTSTGLRPWSLVLRPLFRLRTLSLLLALIGYWTPWLTHPVAALRLNGFELSEWVTFLPGVRDGSLPFNRLAFLIPLACLALLLSITASHFRSTLHNSWLRPKWPSS